MEASRNCMGEFCASSTRRVLPRSALAECEDSAPGNCDRNDLLTAGLKRADGGFEKLHGGVLRFVDAASTAAIGIGGMRGLRARQLKIHMTPSVGDDYDADVRILPKPIEDPLVELRTGSIFQRNRAVSGIRIGLGATGRPGELCEVVSRGICDWAKGRHQRGSVAVSPESNSRPISEGREAKRREIR